MLIPEVAVIGKVDNWEKYWNAKNNKATRIRYLLDYNDNDYRHWQATHKNKPFSHFMRYLANLSAYCEAGHGSCIYAFHDPIYDDSRFRETCRKWLDRTVNQSELLIGDNIYSPEVLVPIWKREQINGIDRILDEPVISNIANPNFQGS